MIHSDDHRPYRPTSSSHESKPAKPKPALKLSLHRRIKSLPGSPTSKSVQFDDDLQHVRYFQRNDKPSSISAQSSPTEKSFFDIEQDYQDFFNQTATSTRDLDTGRYKLLLCNFPTATRSRKGRPVYLEDVTLSPHSNSLVGTIAVANLAFEKTVLARFSLDNWATVSEVIAEFQIKDHSLINDPYDRFRFEINLDEYLDIETKKLSLCVRYCVGGNEYWDNNMNQNFDIRFTKQKSKPEPYSYTFGSHYSSYNSNDFNSNGFNSYNFNSQSFNNHNFNNHSFGKHFFDIQEYLMADAFL